MDSLVVLLSGIVRHGEGAFRCDLGGPDLRSGSDLLQTFYDQLVAGPEPLGNQPVIANHPLSLKRSEFYLIIFTDNQSRRFTALIPANSALWSENRLINRALLHDCTYKHTR